MSRWVMTRENPSQTQRSSSPSFIPGHMRCEGKTWGKANLKSQKQEVFVWEGLKMIPDICLCHLLLKLKDSRASVDNLS